MPLLTSGRVFKVALVAAAAVGTGHFLGKQAERSAMLIDAVREKYGLLQLSGSPEAVITGGTSGIGEGVAIRLAEAGVAVTIVGRDAVRGRQVLDRLQLASPAAGARAGQHRFVRCDAFSLANVAACADEIKQGSASGKLDYLVLSQGMATTQGFTPTADGLDQKLTLHYWSRMALLTHLLPMLEAAPAGARVLSVLSGGVHGAPATYKEDPELKLNYGLKAAADTAGFYNDIGLDSLSRAHPTVGFVHAAPGFVNTRWGTELPLVLRGLTRAMQCFGKSPATCADFMTATLFDPARATGFHVATENAEPASPVPEHEAGREFVWAHTQRVLAAGKSVQ